MLLLACATEMELQGLPERVRRDPSVCCLVTGVGPVETALRLTNHLSRPRVAPNALLNFGVGGAYPSTGLGLLDICLAESEVLGDLGVACAVGIQPLPEAVRPPGHFGVDPRLLVEAVAALKMSGRQARRGPFVTVCCGSGTDQRGRLLRDAYSGICENMEGAAVARVCSFFDIPFLELRCISNMVEDRDTSSWRLQEAAIKGGHVAGLLAMRLLTDQNSGPANLP